MHPSGALISYSKIEVSNVFKSNISKFKYMKNGDRFKIIGNQIVKIESKTSFRKVTECHGIFLKE